MCEYTYYSKFILYPFLKNGVCGKAIAEAEPDPSPRRHKDHNDNNNNNNNNNDVHHGPKPNVLKTIAKGAGRILQGAGRLFRG